MTLSRRDLFRAAGVVAGASAVPAAALAAPARAGTSTRRFTLTATAFGAGMYLYLPFRVPVGVNRVDVAMAFSGDAALGVGLFDERGPGYQSPGFRGIYGEERHSFFVTAHSASPAFLPGTIRPGPWTVVVPVFRAPRPTQVTVDVTLRFGPQQRAYEPGPEPGVVRDDPGWYRGDLHCHTGASSDASASGSALSPRGWADEARRLGLDFLAMTDHNVVSQNLNLAADAGRGVLLMAGEEMTNWFHGHATVSGISPGDWLDWRQRPQGVPLEVHERRIGEFLRVAKAMGAYVSAAHPLAAHLSYQFFGEAEATPSARTHGVEVWTGPFQADDEAALRAWDRMLQRGQRIFANGGSDLHGFDNTQGFAVGTPTTVVYAARLAKDAIVAALRAGRSFVTRRPDGAELYLTAVGPDGHRAIVGGTVRGEPGDFAHVAVRVQRGAGMRLVLWRDGAAVSITPIEDDEAVVRHSLPFGAGGYVRAELRGRPFVDHVDPAASRTDMEAFTNPIFLDVV